VVGARICGSRVSNDVDDRPTREPNGTVICVTASNMPDAIPQDSAESAEIAGLRFVTDNMPGIRRIRRGRGLNYRAPDNSPVRD
jgi:hypothetical protein